MGSFFNTDAWETEIARITPGPPRRAGGSLRERGSPNVTQIHINTHIEMSPHLPSTPPLLPPRARLRRARGARRVTPYIYSGGTLLLDGDGSHQEISFLLLLFLQYCGRTRLYLLTADLTVPLQYTGNFAGPRASPPWSTGPTNFQLHGQRGRGGFSAGLQTGIKKRTHTSKMLAWSHRRKK